MALKGWMKGKGGGLWRCFVFKIPMNSVGVY